VKFFAEEESLKVVTEILEQLKDGMVVVVVVPPPLIVVVVVPVLAWQ
jgi:hypothetical protein